MCTISMLWRGGEGRGGRERDRKRKGKGRKEGGRGKVWVRGRVRGERETAISVLTQPKASKMLSQSTERIMGGSSLCCGYSLEVCVGN